MKENRQFLIDPMFYPLDPLDGFIELSNNVGNKVYKLLFSFNV